MGSEAPIPGGTAQTPRSSLISDVGALHLPPHNNCSLLVLKFFYFVYKLFSLSFIYCRLPALIIFFFFRNCVCFFTVLDYNLNLEEKAYKNVLNMNVMVRNY